VNESSPTEVQEALGLCHRVSKDSIMDIFNWISSGFAYMAMSSYPYPSSYILSGDGVLPAYPVQVACSVGLSQPLKGLTLLEGIRKAMDVFYNATRDKPCFELSTPNNETEITGIL